MGRGNDANALLHGAGLRREADAESARLRAARAWSREHRAEASALALDHCRAELCQRAGEPAEQGLDEAPEGWEWLVDLDYDEADGQLLWGFGLYDPDNDLVEAHHFPVPWSEIERLLGEEYSLAFLAAIEKRRDG
jgi:hypothetical protein